MTLTLDHHGAATQRLVTRSGLLLDIRPVGEHDEAALFDLFATLSPADLRFRFLSAVRTLSAAHVRPLIDIDHDRTEHVLAFDDATKLVGSMMLAIGTDGTTAEVAIAVAGAKRDQGIGWALLRYAAELARARGVRHLQTIESVENQAAIALERAMGFNVRPYPGDASLVLVEATL